MSAVFPLSSEPRDVPIKTLGPLIRGAAQFHASADELLAEAGLTPRDIEDASKRLTWTEFCIISDRICDAVGGLPNFETCGQSVVDAGSLRTLMKLAQLAASPATLYRLAARLGAPKLFPMITSSFETTSDRTGTFELHITEPHRICKSFFAFNAGCLRALPRLLGVPETKLTWHVEGRTCTYTLQFAPSMTLWSRVRHILQYMFNLESAYEEQRATQEELVRQGRELNRQNERLRFAYVEAQRKAALEKALLRNVSHELRTPMNGIIGNLELLCSELKDDELRTSARDALDSSERMMRLVTNLVNLKVETLAVSDAPVRPHEFLKAIGDNFEQRATARENRIVIDVQDKLPDAFLIDPELLRTILTSLTDNAVKFTLRGVVTLRARVDGNDIKFEIEDSGVGMNKETIARAFDPFEQADSSLIRDFEGLGIGLPVAKRLVEALGGRLRVDSAPGLGSRFWFSLPLRPVEAPTCVDDTSTRIDGPRSAEASERLADGPTSAAAEEAQYQATVLIVEDNATNTAILRRICGREGLRVLCAEDGVEALEILSGADRIDLILMDCQMPRLDGYEATRRIRQMNAPTSQLPIVAVTAHALEEDRERCFDAGMDDFVAKPVRPAVIKEKISVHLGQAGPVISQLVNR